jgi:hypothetical protein
MTRTARCPLTPVCPVIDPTLPGTIVVYQAGPVTVPTRVQGDALGPSQQVQIDKDIFCGQVQRKNTLRRFAALCECTIRLAHADCRRIVMVGASTSLALI